MQQRRDPSTLVRMSREHACRLTELALGGLHREYPNKIAHVLDSDADVLPPRKLTPVFYGCFDWHSAVHSHWTVLRWLRLAPDHAHAQQSEAALDRSFSEANVAGEVSYLGAPGREAFEVPYGLAWLLLLGHELAEWSDARAARWSRALAPLLELARARLERWIDRLPYPVRSGEHSQSAFALGLMIDTTPQPGRLTERALRLYGSDRDAPIHLEPSGNDFFSPSLASADLLRRVLEPSDFATWLGDFFPSLGADGWLEPVHCPDPSDGKLAHLVGLLLSRAWMLEGIAAGLPPHDERVAVLRTLAARHRSAGLGAIDDQHYVGTHWQGSFATYLLTQRGLDTAGRP